MASFEIVQLTPDQWQPYKSLRLEALQTEPQAFGASLSQNLGHPDEYWIKRLKDVQSGDKNWLLFARVDGELVGMIGAFIEEDPTVVIVISMYVTKECRGLGIAKALLSRLTDLLEFHSSARTFRLCVNRNQTAAVRLYEESGFKTVRKVSGTMGDGLCHEEFVMERDKQFNVDGS